ncbi:uncharacterized protein K452DRAFT_298615 [Aplosporella prunicola CBS 121167]|uniref:BHLH domain-containing protein n=1 Tax=Aplosporella prunicola CBS 121167 TaxID=1176127 RepID=A0A6A6BDA7_9PEZI|nr:uncharacterized protein K452DRAFT_298615 [Aplosporella prunicola CBS 121167]KAF2141214.1 hypothetical protein K452DRAFT_298615 [Aplosporella prunicola CBS 121167]
MLALARPPGMSSHQDSAKDDSPFGYTFSGHIDNAAASENVTAAGPPLLSDYQFNELQSFFDRGPFNNFDSAIPFPDPAHDPSNNFDFSFFDDAPTTLHGTSAAIPEPAHNQNLFPAIEPRPGPSYSAARNNDLHGGASDEVIGAATALLSSAQPQEQMYMDKAYLSGGNFIGLPSPPASAPDQHSLTASANDGSLAVGVPLFNPPRPPLSARHSVYATQVASSFQRPAGLPRFGSDSNFRGNGFATQHHHETEEAVLQRLYKDMEGLQPSNSMPSTRTNTQPPSPILQKRLPSNYNHFQEVPRPKRSSSPRPQVPFGVIPIEPTPVASDEEDSSSDDSASPRERAPKRRRTLAGENGFQSHKLGSAASAAAAAPRAASFSVAQSKKPKDVSISVPSAKRKASSTQKPTRENLSEEQKRNNHILSEQKRRNLIKQGFEELNELVPGLKTGGFSKSSVLMEGAKFLETLVDGNEILKRALGEV